MSSEKNDAASGLKDSLPRGSAKRMQIAPLLIVAALKTTSMILRTKLKLVPSRMPMILDAVQL
jgi:hypothetical protein